MNSRVLLKRQKTYSSLKLQKVRRTFDSLSKFFKAYRDVCLKRDTVNSIRWRE